MALINIANKLAMGCHQTGSSYGPDDQHVCKVLVVLWLVVKASGNFTIDFKETNILPQSPASPVSSLPAMLAPVQTMAQMDHMSPESFPPCAHQDITSSIVVVSICFNNLQPQFFCFLNENHAVLAGGNSSDGC